MRFQLRMQLEKIELKQRVDENERKKLSNCAAIQEHMHNHLRKYKPSRDNVGILNC